MIWKVEQAITESALSGAGFDNLGGPLGRRLLPAGRH
jgi:hypothetical protein